MRPTSRNLLTRILIAVEMRMEGHKWEAIGQRLRRSARTCRRWPVLYVREWNRFYDRIDDHLNGQAAQDARRVLHRHLLSEDARIRDSAARALHRSQDGRRARRPDDELAADATDQKTPESIANENGLTDEKLNARIEKIMRKRGWTPPPDAPGAGSPPGPPESE